MWEIQIKHLFKSNKFSVLFPSVIHNFMSIIKCDSEGLHLVYLKMLKYLIYQNPERIPNRPVYVVD